MAEKQVVPNHVQIEVVNGYCTARCIFCTIGNWTRQKNIMTTDFFQRVLDTFDCIKDRLEFLTLMGCGEPLLDPEMHLKIAYAKARGYKGIGFATNATELSGECSLRLIEAGLDTLIISIDGLDKATHERIRVGTDFDLVCANAKKFLQIRDEINGKTRVIVRFVRGQDNYDQWPDFQKYWLNYVDLDKKDDVVMHNVHNWGKGEKTVARREVFLCPDLFEKIVVYADGRMALCCVDDNGCMNFPSVLDLPPLETFNGKVFNHYRELMKQGRVDELERCKNCTVLDARMTKVKPRHMKA